MVTTVMLKDEEERLLVEARDAIIHRGLNSLKPEFRNEIEKVNLERLTKGTVVALSAVLLIYLLEKSERG